MYRNKSKLELIYTTSVTPGLNNISSVSDLITLSRVEEKDCMLTNAKEIIPST